MLKMMMTGLAIFLLFSVSVSHLSAAEKACKEYPKQVQQQQHDYLSYCLQDWPSKLFPEYDELAAMRKADGKDMSEADYMAPEKSWCTAVDDKAFTELQEKRETTLKGCKSKFKQLFGKMGKTLDAVVPKGFERLESNDKAALAHDFNDDGKDDYVFMIVKDTTDDRARLMVALSQDSGALKTVPVAAYVAGNFGENSGRPDTGIRLLKPNGFIMATQSLDINNWDSRSEWIFRFVDGQFVLARSTSGYTKISYDEVEASINESSVRDYEKGIAFKSISERCDYYNPEKPDERCESAEDTPLPAMRLTLENFTDEKIN